MKVCLKSDRGSFGSSAASGRLSIHGAQNSAAMKCASSMREAFLSVSVASLQKTYVQSIRHVRGGREARHLWCPGRCRHVLRLLHNVRPLLVRVEIHPAAQLQIYVDASGFIGMRCRMQRLLSFTLRAPCNVWFTAQRKGSASHMYERVRRIKQSCGRRHDVEILGPLRSEAEKSYPNVLVPMTSIV